MTTSNRISVVAIIAQTPECAEKVNALLHDFSSVIVGRMGLPYRERGLHIISIVLDAPSTTVNALTGKLGMLSGVSAKALFSDK